MFQIQKIPTPCFAVPVMDNCSGNPSLRLGNSGASRHSWICCLKCYCAHCKVLKAATLHGVLKGHKNLLLFLHRDLPFYVCLLRCCLTGLPEHLPDVEHVVNCCLFTIPKHDCPRGHFVTIHPGRRFCFETRVFFCL